jgi:hypothetical protein
LRSVSPSNRRVEEDPFWHHASLAGHPLLFFLPLFLVEISSFAMLTLSPFVKLSRSTLFLLAGMFLIFTVWALFGFAYPAAPLPVALNTIAKILAFATAVSLFLPPEKSAWFARQFVPARQEIGQ